MIVDGIRLEEQKGQLRPVADVSWETPPGRGESCGTRWPPSSQRLWGAE